MSNSKHSVWLGVPLAILLGWLGMHRAYIGRYRSCLLYGMFSWTGIPLLVSWVEAFIMPRRIRQANAEGRKVEWKKAVACSVVGFILLFPTCVAILLPLSYLAEAEEVNNTHEDMHVEELFENAQSLMRNLNLSEEERTVMVRAKEIPLYGVVAYEEQALPALLAMLSPSEFASTFMPHFHVEKARLSSVQARTIPSPRALRNALRRAQFGGNEEEAERLRAKLATVEHFLEGVSGKELLLRFDTGDEYYETGKMDLSESIHLSYIHYHGEYRLARVFFTHTPLKWADIFEYVHQLWGSGDEGK